MPNLSQFFDYSSPQSNIFPSLSSLPFPLSVIDGKSQAIEAKIKFADNRRYRYKIQRRVKKILKPDRSIFNTSKEDDRPRFVKDKWFNIRSCGVTSNSGGVAVVHSPSSNSSSYSGVRTCGSVWSCPVCSYKVADHRSYEIDLGIKNFYKSFPSGRIMMMVLTHSHTNEDLLSVTVKKRTECIARCFSQRGVKEIFKKYKILYKINCFEITVSQFNGWHPHNHILLFSEAEIDMESLQSELLPYWIKSLESVGLSGSCDRALCVCGGDKASKYVTGLTKEITLGAFSKLGKNTSEIKHYTPFQLVAYVEENPDNSGWASARFYEFSIVMRGKKQIVWSRGAKKALGIKQVSDEEAAEQKENDSVSQVLITNRAWYKLCKYGYDYRPLVLEVSEYGKTHLIKLLKQLEVDFTDLHDIPYIRSSLGKKKKKEDNGYENHIDCLTRIDRNMEKKFKREKIDYDLAVPWG